MMGSLNVHVMLVQFRDVMGARVMRSMLEHEREWIGYFARGQLGKKKVIGTQCYGDISKPVW